MDYPTTFVFRMQSGILTFSVRSSFAWLGICALILATSVAKGQVPVEVDRNTLAQQALEANDPNGCLAQLEQLSEKQRKSAKNQWLQVRCLQASWEAKSTDERVAAACMVSCARFASDFADETKNKGNVDNARRWLNGLRKHFDHDGLQYKSLRHVELPVDQQQALANVQQFLEQYVRESQYTNIEHDLQDALALVVDLDLPMPNGETPFIYCLHHDAKEPFQTLLIYDKQDRADRINRLMLSAVAYDAPEITSKLLNEYFGERNKGTEDELLEVAVEKHANRVLLQWFNARSSDRIPGLNTWDQIAPRHATALAQAAITVGDTTFLRQVMNYGVDPDSLGSMVFNAIEGAEPFILDILLDRDPPSEARDTAGLSYLHKAMALDSPEALTVLFKHGWFKKLAGETDRDGLPAVHYLVTQDLPNILAKPTILAHLDLNATDLQGFTLLHKLVFRPDTMSLPAGKLLGIILKNSTKLNRDKAGPYYDWTALHYAVRQDRPDLVAVLVKEKAIYRAHKHVKDTWKRTPKDVAKEHGYKKVLKAL